MRLKEVLSMLLVIAVVVVSVFLIAEAFRDEKKEARYSKVDWSTVQDDESERLHITWLGIPRFANSKEDTWVEERLEKEFNIELDPIFIDGNAYTRRKPLMFASGLVPDVFWEGDPYNLRLDTYHGFTLEIPYSVLLKYAPNYTRFIAEKAPNGWLFSYFQGRNYGLPTAGLVNNYPIPGIWRKDWLEAVGITKTPETLEEMEEAFYRFRHQDPDGNGQQDTYGMCPNLQTWFSAFSDVFGAFGVLPYDWILQDGKVVWGGVTQEARQTIELLRQWNAKQLLHPDIFAGGQGDDTERKFVSGKTGYLGFRGSSDYLDMSLPTGTVRVLSELQPGSKIAVAAFPIGPKGHRGGRVWGPAGNIMAFGKHLNKEPEKVIRVLKMFEQLYLDGALFMEARTGKRGVHWDFNQEKGLHFLPPMNKRGVAKRHLLNQQLDRSTGFYSACGAPRELADRFTRRRWLEHRERYQKPQWALQNVIGRAGVVPSANEYLDDLRKMQMTFYAELIRGDRPLSDFEVFVENWHRLGGETMTREANELYRTRQDILRQVVGGRDE